MDPRTSIISKWLGTGSINIFGLPFSGKDTQAKQLANLFNAELVGGGDILRSHHEPEKIEKLMAEGQIIPSDFYLSLVLAYFSRQEFGGKPLVLSAVGRSHGEETAVMKAATDSGHPIRVAILLKLSEEEVWKRFDTAKHTHDRGERQDDQSEVIKNRLKQFQDKTVRVIDFYRREGLLLEVDGQLSREEVTNAILDGLYSRAL